MSAQTASGPVFSVTERFDIAAMQEFMRQPSIYWPGADALAPPPEAVQFAEHMLHPNIWTLAATHGQYIVGFVQFNLRTSIGAELHVGFHPQYRGIIARQVVQFALHTAFSSRGLLKVWAPIPSDNKAALMGARLLGFVCEGRIRNAIVRNMAGHGGPPLADLVLMSKSKSGVH